MSAPVSILSRVEDFLQERRQLGFALRKHLISDEPQPIGLPARARPRCRRLRAGTA
jgi:hypothetical protein